MNHISTLSFAAVSTRTSPHLARTTHMNIEDYQMKMIRLIDDFVIVPEITDPHDSFDDTPFRHFCCDRPMRDSLCEEVGWPLYRKDVNAGKCDWCSKPMPPKVLFMYKLWCFQNNR